ncbi:asparaginase domain-containing protein [Brachybacterium halotolerans subsp. kimchii]|uniref:asparaginase n=1 Tax=Brachybacterium halotolerans TaxID=2795215 RepID=UPI001E479029|nr:asparaginase domain-containing protein [Brachybacterium halotolerans]UEJ81713.1 asparaginase domain-containing protein [Brachybacterium halotolerans subsp. kimchii]
MSIPDDSPAPDLTARIHVLSLGGTIFMTAADGAGAAPGAGGADVVAAGLPAGVQVTHEEVANIGSPSVRPGHLGAVLERARTAVDAGARGVVLTHGTDTLEESAFVLDALWDRDAPLVLTGAMRPSDAPGADGPANVRDAIRAAAAPALRGLGALAVFDGAAHLGARVRKLSSRSVSAFGSVPAGALAVIDEGTRLLQRPAARATHAVDRPLVRLLAGASAGTSADPSAGPSADPTAAGRPELPDPLPRVPVISLGIGDEGEILDDLPLGSIAGLVVDGAGMGHVPAGAMPRLRRLVAEGVPVVVATRIPDGGTSTHHYSYPGSEVDLLASGCLMAGVLPAHKARLLLQLALARGLSAAGIGEAFALFAS